MKDLSVFGENLQRTVLVDNDLGVFLPQPDNGILVQDYLGGAGEDEELVRIARVLEELILVEDVRDVLRPKFDLRNRLARRLARMKELENVDCADMVVAFMEKVVLQKNPAAISRLRQLVRSQRHFWREFSAMIPEPVAPSTLF